MAEVYLIASGKGGVGKSTLAAALGCALAEKGARVTVIDADIGLRAQDALLTLENQVVYDILDVVSGDCPLSQALLHYTGLPGLSLLPAAQFARAKALDGKHLRSIIRSLQETNDYILIDCPAGIERGFRNVVNVRLCRAILVTTPDDIAIRDAERAASVLSEKGLDRPWLIVNRLQEDLIRHGDMYSAQVVASTLDLPLLGEIPDDPAVYRALLRHLPLIRVDCEARGAVTRIASRLRGESVPFRKYGSGKLPFLRRLRWRELQEVSRADDL